MKQRSTGLALGLAATYLLIAIAFLINYLLATSAIRQANHNICPIVLQLTSPQARARIQGTHILSALDLVSRKEGC